MIGDLVDKDWDVVIIGTGMGGGTLGRRLAEQGKSVLFVERGPNGPRGEQQQLNAEMSDPVARAIRGYWPKPIHAEIEGRTSEFFGAVGAGVGGSSVFYAATLERPERHDVDDSPERVHPTGGWPVSFDTLQPYYDEAELYYHVCGEEDPLSTERPSNIVPPPEMGVGDKSMMEEFQGNGLHPYHVHMAVRFLPGCKQCFGFKCPMKCKMDGRSAGVEPALETGNATLLDCCEIVALRGSKDQITHVEALYEGKVVHITAKRYVLSAGGMGSPRLLLASASKDWPDGCANSSGLVGHNLMFHLTEMLAIWPKKSIRFSGPTKSIAFRDLYYKNGERYGTVQAMGLDASYGEIVHYLKNVFDRSMFRSLKPIRELMRIPALIAAKLFGEAKVFIGIMEDLPYDMNRVVLNKEDPDKLSFEYHFTPEMTRRRREFRKLMKKSVKGFRAIFLTFQPELNFGHSCGTLRFGSDPKTSVLDPSCRAHDIKNLYVADSSFMPTSLGINPSLTIAANAIRVADAIVKDLETSETPQSVEAANA